MYYQIAILFFIVALIYSSVGFGGGSSYLAILSLYGIAFPQMRLIALICNIIVVSGGTIVFMKHKQIAWKKTLPLIITGVPLACLGAIVRLHENIYFIILGITLIVAAILLWIKPAEIKDYAQKINYAKQGLIGGSIGFLSGMVGIGGGIFLSPILNLSGWGTAKQIAAAASVFILANSIAGIAGQLSASPDVDIKMTVALCLAVFAGGQIGSNIGTVKFNLTTVRRVTAIVVLVAGAEVLVKHL